MDISATIISSLISGAVALAGALIAFSWQFSSRFTILETDVKHLSNESRDIKDDIKELRKDVNSLKESVAGITVQVNMLIVHPEILRKGTHPKEVNA